MKTFSTFISLAIIISICATSAVLYLKFEYNLSAVLTIVWIVAMAAWIKANGFLDRQASAN